LSPAEGLQRQGRWYLPLSADQPPPPRANIVAVGQRERQPWPPACCRPRSGGWLSATKPGRAAAGSLATTAVCSGGTLPPALDRFEPSWWWAILVLSHHRRHRWRPCSRACLRGSIAAMVQPSPWTPAGPAVPDCPDGFDACPLDLAALVIAVISCASAGIPAIKGKPSGAEADFNIGYGATVADGGAVPGLGPGDARHRRAFRPAGPFLRSN